MAEPGHPRARQTPPRAPRRRAAGVTRAAAVSGAAAVSASAARVEVSDIQRSRLMAGAVAAVEELGYAQATVGQITRRARVSRRTFYELFEHRDECLAEVLDQVVGQIEGELGAASLGGLSWRERVRTGLLGILAFLDREPALARVCVVHALRAGPVVLGRRDEILARLTAVVDEGRLEGTRGEACTPLTAEGLVGAAFAIVYARLERREPEPLTGLVGELMGMIVLPYLSQAAARRERAAPVALGLIPVGTPSGARDPLRDVRMRVTYRTARVLEGIAELNRQGEGHPSNRQVGACAGVSDPGQISKLLSRLERLGLLTNVGAGHAMGEPNAWALTAQGEQVAQSIRMHRPDQRSAA
jgi:AcrR family transcriptional regulator